MTKAKMIETLQRMESEAWERLTKYEFEQMPLCTADEEIKWMNTDKGYRKKLHEWSAISDALKKCEIKSAFNETAMEYSSGTYRRNKEYREKLKAGA